MDVVAWREQPVEVARLERTAADELEHPGPGAVELLVLVASVEPDEAPGEVVVHRRRRSGRDDEAEQAERAVG